MIKPIRIALAALSLTVVAAGSARADTTYLMTLQGTDQRYYPPCRLIGQPPPCDTIVDLAWTGTLGVVIDSSADGVYSDTDVRSFDFRTNIGSLTLPYSPGSITIADGRITSVDFGPFPGGDGDYDFAGLHATYSRNFDAPHTGSDFATGLLTAVPEPGAASLMILALACIGAAFTRSRRAIS
jgi:hypothetical protein